MRSGSLTSPQGRQILLVSLTLGSPGSSWEIPIRQEGTEASSCGPEFDVEGSDAQLLASLGYILGSQHGSIWRGLISVSLHLTRQMVSLPERSVTWTKVSNDAKVWHTPNTFSSSATRGPRLMACSSFSFPLQGAISAHLQTHHWKELSLEVLRDLKKFYLKPLIS